MGAQEVRPHGAPGLPGPQVEASSPGQDGQLRDYCASGLYILTLLLEGYGFSQETWGGIEFRKQVTAQGERGLGLRAAARSLTGRVARRPVAPTSAGRWATC